MIRWTEDDIDVACAVLVRDCYHPNRRPETTRLIVATGLAELRGDDVQRELLRFAAYLAEWFNWRRDVTLDYALLIANRLCERRGLPPWLEIQTPGRKAIQCRGL